MRKPYAALLSAVLGLAVLLPVDAAVAQKVDLYGDSLPAGAVARLGTVRFRHEANSTTGVVFSPDGKLIATATNNSPYVFVFDVETGKRVAQFGPEDPDANLYWDGASLSFEGDGQSLLIMKLGGHLERLDIKSGQREPLQKSALAQRGICTTADGRFAAILDDQAKIHVVEYATLKPVAELQLDGESEIDAFSFDAASKRLAIGDRKRKKFEVWDIAQRKIIWTADGEGSGFHIALSPTGKLVAYTPLGQGFVVRKVGEEDDALRSESGSAPKSFAFSGDESTLIALNSSTFEFWDLASGEIARKQKIGFARGAYYSPDGKTVALAKSSHIVRLFDAKTGEERPKFETHYGEIKAIAANHDGTRVLTRAWSDSVMVWDVAQQKPIYQHETGSQTPKAMAVTADGKRVIYGWGTMSCFDVETQEKLFTSRLSRGCELLAYSPDGDSIAATDKLEDRHGVSILDASTGERKTLLEAETKTTLVTAAAWMPDGKRVVAYDSPTKISIWDVSTGERTRSFEREKSGVQSLAVHPNGKVLAAVEGGFDAKLRFYRVDTGEPLEVKLEGYDPKLRASAQEVVFTGDGKHLVARIDFRLHIWDLKSRQRVAHLGSQADYISAFALSGDGQRLITASAIDHLLVWELAELVVQLKE